MSEVKIENVMPWGRSYDEYAAMFALWEKDLSSRILSCADGPASFNAEMTASGYSVVSVDPVYAFSREEIEGRINETKDVLRENTKAHLDKYRWDKIKDMEMLERVRMSAMRLFLEDFEEGKREGRYIAGSLPTLEFKNAEFDLVLCSHCLFTYTEQLELEFHIASILEMLRVGREVRIFPLMDMNGEPSRHLEPVTTALKEAGHRVVRVIANYEFQIGGNQQLRVTSKQSESDWAYRTLSGQIND